MEHAPALIDDGGLLDFSAFYDAQFARVYRATWLVSRNEDVALEATQEAFARAWARWRRLGDQDWVIGWVIKTASNIVRDGRFAYRAADPSRDRDSTSVAELLDLRDALGKLPERRRQAVVLFYVGDLSLQLVAETMNVSEGTVKAHLAQGRDSLRRALEVEDE